LGHKPVDEPDDEERREGEQAEEGGLEASLEPPPQGDAAQQLERRARLAEDRLTEVLAAYRKVRTDNEGFRDRVSRNVERRYELRREKLLLRFIDILDNLDRALEAAELSYAGNPLIEGLILVRTQLLQTLNDEGLERIPVLGLPYDPGVSEAVGTQAVPDQEHDHVVVKELMRGYRLSGRVARASRVVVGEYREGAGAAKLASEALIGADETPRGGRVEGDDPAASTPLDDDEMLDERDTGGGD